MSSAVPIPDLATADFAIGECGDEVKQPVGTFERIAGPSGPAVQFDFVFWSHGGTFSTPVTPTPAWDEAAGISFWAKGDGSKDGAALSFADANDEKLRWEYWFSIESTEWRKLTVPWCDFMPLSPHAPFLGKDGYRPSQFNLIRFGKQTWRRHCPAFSFSVAAVELEPEIAVDTTDYTPAKGGTPRLLAKLRAKEPVTIVTVGDSLTDPLHWANSGVWVCWPDLLGAKLKEFYEVEPTVVNAAVGGHQLTQGLTLTALWLPVAPKPDLVTIWFGANDYWNGMTPEHFREVLRFAVDRIRRLTKGQAEVMLFTCAQLRDEWDALAALSQVVREVAAEKRTALADVYETLSTFGADETQRRWLFAWDGHLGPFAHSLVAMTVGQAIAAE